MRYPSDLTDSQWDNIEHLFPPERQPPGKPGRRRTCRECSLEQLLAESSQALDNLLAGAASPSESAQRREMSVVLANALAELSDEQREVIVLRSLQEQDWPKVARRMGRTAGAVRMLWVRALKRLRPLIEKQL